MNAKYNKKLLVGLVMVLTIVAAFAVGSASARTERISIAYEDDYIILYDDTTLGGTWGINKAGGIAFSCPCEGCQIVPQVQYSNQVQVIQQPSDNQQQGPNGPIQNGPNGPIQNGPNGPIQNGPNGPIQNGPNGPIETGK